jgi:uncharacterized protein YndB with AHSA1/START domain
MTEAIGPNDLELIRRLKAPRRNVWRCWTEPELLKQWFCPRPWYVSDVVMDLRPGGNFSTTMNGPNGESFPNPGCWLEIVPQERLAFTNVLQPGWRPALIPEGEIRMTAIIQMRDDAGGGTVVTSRALHMNDVDREKHEKMGFYDGWGAASDQLDELAQTV